MESKYNLNVTGMIIKKLQPSRPIQKRRALVTTLIICLFSTFSFVAAGQSKYQVLVVKSTSHGVVVDTTIDTAGGVLNFVGKADDGYPIYFNNLKGILDYMDTYGYNLVDSIRLTPDEGETGDEHFAHIQHVFKFDGSGKEYPILIF